MVFAMVWAMAAMGSAGAGCGSLRPSRALGSDAGRASTSRGGARHEGWAPAPTRTTGSTSPGTALGSSTSALAGLGAPVGAEVAPGSLAATTRRRRGVPTSTRQRAVRQVASVGVVATKELGRVPVPREEEKWEDGEEAERARWVAVQRLKVANAVREILEKSVVGGVVSEEEWAANVPGAVDVVGLRAMLTEGRASRIWLLDHHAGLVHSAAFKLRGFVDRDAVQEGLEGLVRAIDMFDPTRGHRFSTYALHWVRARILRADEQHRRTIRLAAGVHWKAVKAERLSAEGMGPREVAKTMGVSMGEVDRLLRLGADTLSLSTPAFVDDGYLATLEDSLSSNSSLTMVGGSAGVGADFADPWEQDGGPDASFVLADFERDLTRSALTDLLEQHLTGLEHAVLALRYGLACPTPAAAAGGGGGQADDTARSAPAFSVRDVSKILGLNSHVAVVRTEERALRKLRNVPDLYALLVEESAPRQEAP